MRRAQLVWELRHSLRAEPDPQAEDGQYALAPRMAEKELRRLPRRRHKDAHWRRLRSGPEEGEAQ